MAILSNLAAILAGILATILDFQPTGLFRRFNLVTLDFLTHKKFGLVTKITTLK